MDKEGKKLFNYLDKVKKSNDLEFERRWLVIFYNKHLMKHPDIRAFNEADDANKFSRNIGSKDYITVVTPYSKSDDVMNAMMNDYIYQHNKVEWK